MVMVFAGNDLELAEPRSTCKKMPTGTREWADSNVNVISGCAHNCRYCYAKKMAIRFGRKTANNWKQMEVNQTACNRKYLKRAGRIMFPTTHDLVPDPSLLNPCLNVLEKLLKSGNEILVTSKPWPTVIRQICDLFNEYRQKIQFRFTIGSCNTQVLSFWEPGAPTFEERLEALQVACANYFKTSISIEPFLDFDPIPLVEQLRPYVTESIWIGRMNYIDRKNLTEKEIKQYDAIRENYTLKNVQSIYKQYKTDPLIRWKDRIKEMLAIY
jgi:DNA repair photolyase